MNIFATIEELKLGFLQMQEEIKELKLQNEFLKNSQNPTPNYTKSDATYLGQYSNLSEEEKLATHLPLSAQMSTSESILNQK